MQAEAWAEANRRTEAARHDQAWEFRGNNQVLQTMTDPEILLCGPAGSGKTLAILVKIHRLMQQHQGARTLIVRKVRADLAQSTLVTYERDVLGEDNPICAGVQRSSRESYKYPNGSEVVVGGMDRPGRILSAEYDFIYPAEAVQFTEEDWETFVMRNRNGVLPFQQVVGDTNPDHPQHWLKKRCDEGLTRLINSYHRDNPRYWSAALNEWTQAGVDYVLGKLARLKGVRKKRYLENKWSIAEGAVYEGWNEDVHLIDSFPIPPEWRRFRCVDFGYTNPFVCQWWAMDHDGRLYLYREIYMTRRTVKVHADQIQRLTAGATLEDWQHWTPVEKAERLKKGERIEATVADHDAEDRATLKQEGIATVPAKKEIGVGIQAVEGRLELVGDEGMTPRQRGRLFVMRGALVELDVALDEEKKPTSTAAEFPAYVWPKGVDGKPKKEVPVDEDNHGMDCVRYMVRHVDGGVARVRRNPIYGGGTR